MKNKATPMTTKPEKQFGGASDSMRDEPSPTHSTFPNSKAHHRLGAQQKIQIADSACVAAAAAAVAVAVVVAI
jgi:hypothetical protein